MPVTRSAIFPVNLRTLNRFEEGARVDEAALRATGLGQRPSRVGSKSWAREN